MKSSLQSGSKLILRLYFKKALDMSLIIIDLSVLSQSQACKVLKTFVSTGIMLFLHKLNNLTSQHQHGFTRGRSCLTNLLTALNDWTSALDDGIRTDVIYLDFQKAFDTVPHHQLGTLLRWIEDFLSGRSHKILNSCVNFCIVNKHVDLTLNLLRYVIDID